MPPLRDESSKPCPRRSGRRLGSRPRAVWQAVALAGFLAAAYAVSFLSSQVITAHSVGWYATASKAPWTPPGWMFGSAWALLYTAMAVAAWLVWRQRSAPRRGALAVYAVLLLVNFSWAPTFFGMYPAMGAAALWLAMGLIVLHALVAAATVVLFGLISRTAGLLMLPYVSWIVFSSSLNLYAAAHN